MAVDANKSRGGKAPSLGSRLSDVEAEFVLQSRFLRGLCEALLVPQPELERAKILALLATMSDTGRGARLQHGE